MTAKTEKLLQPFKSIISEKLKEGYPPGNLYLEYGKPSPYKEKQGYFLSRITKEGKIEAVSGIIRSNVFKDESDLKDLCRDMKIQYCL